VRAVALAQLHSVSSAVRLPIVGIGGVQRGLDAIDLLHAGADLVAVGTESFRDPAAGLRIAAELDSLLGSVQMAASSAPEAQSVSQTPASSAFSR
jgi:dihydroorotate dehydrogenase (NAD+) catalytic subunit